MMDINYSTPRPSTYAIKLRFRENMCQKMKSSGYNQPEEFKRFVKN
jgi:hypothetical protein